MTETAAVTLTDFLNARLDEDRAVAREAAGLTECWVAEEPAIGIVLVDGEPLIEGHITGLTAHIARHDPARVLREVEAKRAVIATAFLYEATIDGEWGCVHNADEIAAGRCPDIRPDKVYILRLLAAIYSDHPDYRDEWKP